MRVIVLVIALALAGCSDRWEGFVYPDKENLTKHFGIGEYETLEACRWAARTALLQHADRGLEQGDYECGLNCKPFGNDMKVCDKTER